MNIVLMITITSIITSIIAFTLILILVTRRRGCTDRRAYNYNKKNNIHDQSMCIYEDEQLPKKTGCAKKWSLNYNKGATHDNDTCINENTLLNMLTILSSQKRSVMMINDKFVIDGGIRGLTFILINRDKTLTIKDMQTFDIGVMYDEIVKMIEYIKKIDDEVVVVISKGETFNLFEMYENKDEVKKMIILMGTMGLQSLGGKNNNFNEKSNYILIGSKLKDIYFETESMDDVYFPNIEMTDYICKPNTAHIKPPKKYYFYRDITSTDDHKIKCALEANRKGYNKFGLERNVCFLINDSEWDSIKNINNSSNCKEGIGSFTSISGYTFKKNVSTKKIYLNNIGIKIYGNKDYTGKMTMLGEGMHDIRSFGKIRSLIIPESYIVHIIYYIGNERRAKTVYGEYKTRINLSDIRTIYIIKLLGPQVHFCDKSNKCYTYGIGKYSLPGYLYKKIERIHMDPGISNVILYQDSNFLDPVIKFNLDGEHKKIISYPKIIRSVEIK